MTLDFKTVFTQIGLLFINGLRNRMLRQEGIDGSSYSRPEPSSLRARQRQLGKFNLAGRVRKSPLKSVPITRMVVSRDTALSAFQSTARKDGLTVFVSDKKHRQHDIAYSELIKFNSRGTGETNPNIKSPPLIFPNNSREVGMMGNEMEVAWNMFVHEARLQVERQTRFQLRMELEIG